MSSSHEVDLNEYLQHFPKKIFCSSRAECFERDFYFLHRLWMLSDLICKQGICQAWGTVQTICFSWGLGRSEKILNALLKCSAGHHFLCASCRVAPWSTKMLTSCCITLVLWAARVLLHEIYLWSIKFQVVKSLTWTERLWSMKRL